MAESYWPLLISPRASAYNFSADHFWVSSVRSGRRPQPDRPSRTLVATTTNSFFCIAFCRKVLPRFNERLIIADGTDVILTTTPNSADLPLDADFDDEIDAEFPELAGIASGIDLSPITLHLG